MAPVTTKSTEEQHEVVEKELSNGDSSASPDSPISSNTSDSDDDESSQHSGYDYQGAAAELQLTPHVSHTSIQSGTRKGFAEATLKRTQTAGTSATNSDPRFEVDFEDNDKRNPREWALWIKGCIIATMSFGTTTVVLYSTSYTSAIPGLQASFGISDQIGILGVTTYLLGMACGSIVLAPLSEMYGRRPIYIGAIALFALFLLPSALAKNIETILITRFFGAFAAAAMISNAPGTVNDVINEEYRALAFSVWSIGPMNGPVLGPVIGGFVYEYMGWRWTNWMVLILTGVTFATVSMIPETYAPAILRSRAKKRRKETGDDRYWSRYDDKFEFWELLQINLKRPIVMAVTEPICIFWDVYVAVVYGILYLCFVAYPIVFTELRGWSPGFSGLAFCGIGVGSMLIIVSEPLIRKMINSHKKDPATGHVTPEAMVSVVCIASILLPVGELIFAWTCTPNIHWIVPILAGIPFGAGNAGVFIYASNYLVHSYGIYAASALAGNSVLRCILGATLPLSGPSMYSALGPHWAGTTLAILEAICIPIPFVFYRYGSKIRMKSTLIRSMQEDKARLDAKKKRGLERLEREAEKRGEAEASEGAGMDSGAAMDEEVVEEMGARREMEAHEMEEV